MLGIYTSELDGRLYSFPEERLKDKKSLGLTNYNVGRNRVRLHGCSINKYNKFIGFFVFLFGLAKQITIIDRSGKVSLVYVNSNSIYKYFARMLASQDKPLNWSYVDSMKSEYTKRYDQANLDRIKKLVDQFFEPNVATYKTLSLARGVKPGEVATLQEALFYVLKESLGVQHQQSVVLTKEQIEQGLKGHNKDKTQYFTEHFWEIWDHAKHDPQSELYKRCVASWHEIKQKILDSHKTGETLAMRIRNKTTAQLFRGEKELEPFAPQNFLHNTERYQGPRCYYTGCGYKLTAHFNFYPRGEQTLRQDQLKKFGKDGYPIDQLMIDKRNAGLSVLTTEEAKDIAEVITHNQLKWINFSNITFQPKVLKILGDAIGKSTTLKSINFQECQQCASAQDMELFWKACGTLKTVASTRSNTLLDGVQANQSVEKIFAIPMIKPTKDQFESVVKWMETSPKVRGISLSICEQADIPRIVNALTKMENLKQLHLTLGKLPQASYELIAQYLKNASQLERFSLSFKAKPKDLPQSLWEALGERTHQLKTLALDHTNIEELSDDNLRVFCEMMKKVKTTEITLGDYYSSLRAEKFFRQLVYYNDSIQKVTFSVNEDQVNRFSYDFWKDRFDEFGRVNRKLELKIYVHLTGESRSSFEGLVNDWKRQNPQSNLAIETISFDLSKMLD